MFLSLTTLSPGANSAGLRMTSRREGDPGFPEGWRVKDQERGDWLCGHSHSLRLRRAGGKPTLVSCSFFKVQADGTGRLTEGFIFNPFIAQKGRSRDGKTTTQILEHMWEQKEESGPWISNLLQVRNVGVKESVHRWHSAMVCWTALDWLVD